VSDKSEYFSQGSLALGALSLASAEREALAFLLPLSDDYPGIDRWFLVKVVPALRTGNRHMLRIERDGKLVGVGIAKNEPDERKICTVRVAPAYANRGIGVRIFDGLLKWLDDDKPHLTVSERKLPLFERIFDYYGFNLSSARKGLYLPTACELGYNEPEYDPNLEYGGQVFGTPIDVRTLSTSGSSMNPGVVVPYTSGSRRTLA
jgi:GNAT superfamily N-acetyltransferase